MCGLVKQPNHLLGSLSKSSQKAHHARVTLLHDKHWFMASCKVEDEGKLSKSDWKFPSECQIQFNKTLRASSMVMKSASRCQYVGYWRSHQRRNCISLSEETNWKLQLGRQLMSGILIHCCKVDFILLPNAWEQWWSQKKRDRVPCLMEPGLLNINKAL